MDEERVFLKYKDAVKLLPRTKMVHTFRQGGPALIGADWDKKDLLKAMKKAERIEVTGPQAQAMKHGLCIVDDYGNLFIETTQVTKEVSP